MQHIVEQQQLSRRRYVTPDVCTKVVFPDGGLEVLAASLFVTAFILFVTVAEEEGGL